MIRLAAFDLDNTLISADLTLSPRVQEAVARAMAQGVIVAIATRRGPSPPDPAVIPIIARLSEARGWNLQFETPTMIYLPRKSNHPEEIMNLLRVSNWKRVDDFLTDLPEIPHKFILSVHDRSERDALAAELRASFDQEFAKITVVPSHPILVEGLPHGMSKAVGLAWLAAPWNI